MTMPGDLLSGESQRLFPYCFVPDTAGFRTGLPPRSNAER
jgi:hypothetical protein